jgi:hypothetical protein
LFVIEAARADEFDPADLHPNEIIGVVNDTHLIGFSVADSNASLVSGMGCGRLQTISSL